MVLLCLAGVLTPGAARAACDPAIAGQVRAALGTYLDGFNSRDAASWAATLSYPHVQIGAGAVPQVWPTPEASAAAFAEARRFQPGWDRSLLSSTEVLWCSANAAYARVNYLHYDAVDSAQSSLRGMYVLTRANGRWGVQARFWGLTPAGGELGYDASRGARHGLEEFLAGQQERSAEAMAASANLPLVTLVAGEVSTFAAARQIVDVVAAAGPDLCGPLPELSDVLLSSGDMVIMAGHLRSGAQLAAADLPNLYVLTDQDGHWGVSGCAAFPGETSR